MIWAQGIVALIVWCIYGTFMAKRSSRLFAKHQGAPRGFTIAFGIIVMVAGLAVLVAGGMGVVAMGGMEGGELTPMGWIATIAIGLVFVHFQTMAAVSMFAVALQKETPDTAQTSESEEKQ